MKRYFLVFTLILSAIQAFGQSPKRATIPEYILKYKDDAIKDMMKMGVPASITLAQGILESESGNSLLAKSANNHFGIKCHNDWSGETFHQDDDAKDECFRKYNTVLESYDDHSRFLRERPRYAFLFDYEISDYKSWAHGLKKAGYATNPRYAELLIKLITEYELHQYDMGGKKIPVLVTTPPPVASNTEKPKHQTAPKHTKPDHKTQRTPKTRASINKNEVPFVIAKRSDSWLSIAMENDLRLWQIFKYNDADKNDLINEGDIIYLKPKRGTPSQEFHIAGANETLWQISQKYGVKLKKLIKLNNFTESVAIEEGQKIKLR